MLFGAFFTDYNEKKITLKLFVAFVKKKLIHLLRKK